MAFKNDFIDDMNKRLSEKRFPDDVQVSLDIPEHKFKKSHEKFNYALKSVYDEYQASDVKMFHIILSLQNYFDMNWLVETILDDVNKKIVTVEMNTEYNIPSKKMKKRKSPKIINNE